MYAMLALFGSIAIDVANFPGRPVFTSAHEAPPFVERNTAVTKLLVTPFAIMITEGFDFATAIASMVHWLAVSHVEPSFVVIGSGIHDSPASVDFHTRVVPVYRTCGV